MAMNCKHGHPICPKCTKAKETAGSKGGRKAAANMTERQRKERASAASKARWTKAQKGGK